MSPAKLGQYTGIKYNIVSVAMTVITISLEEPSVKMYS